MTFGARNVSHRVSPALLPDGHVAYTEWRHMGGTNDGHLRMMNTDMTGMKEAFGGELAATSPARTATSRPATSRPRSPIRTQRETRSPNYQMVAIATSRDRTLQAGKLFLINLNGSEANSTATDLTPLVPGDRTASQVGRYYDAEPIGTPATGQFLVSWSDGPVESETLALAGSNAQFGIYLFDEERTPNDALPDLRRPDVLGHPGPPAAARARSRRTTPDAVSPSARGHDHRLAQRLQLVGARLIPRGQRRQGPPHRGVLG